MSLLEDELDKNQDAFHADWTAQATRNWGNLQKHKQYKQSYRRLSCLNTIKSELVVPNFSLGSAAFFLEAHNDALVSHVNASTGAWRSALQALRSCIENTLSAIYFKDHPIELELWSAGKLRTQFTELHSYALKHPMLAKFGGKVTGLDVLKEEYGTLSKAVHGSAANFRMTDKASDVLLWSVDASRVGMWSSREKRVVEAVCLVLVYLFPSALQGTKLTPVRNMLYFAISPAMQAHLKSKLHISVSKP